MKNDLYDTLEKIAGTLLEVVRELRAQDVIQKEAVEKLSGFFHLAPQVYRVGPPQDAFPVPDPELLNVPRKALPNGYCNTCEHSEDNGDKQHSWWCIHRPNKPIRVRAKHTCKHYRK